MTWEQISQYVEITLSLVLILRITLSRLGRVHKILAGFLAVNAFISMYWLLRHYIGIDYRLIWLSGQGPAFVDAVVDRLIDYRLIWLSGQVVVWVLTIWMVYGLLRAMLESVPGILRFSQRTLNISFAAAMAVSLIVGKTEYAASRVSEFKTLLARLIGSAVIFDLAITTTVFLALVGVLAFILWFPVEIWKDLVVLSSGLLVYFACRDFTLIATVLVSKKIWTAQGLGVVNIIYAIISCACLAYWVIFLTPAKERRRMRIGHQWQRQEQEIMIGRLEQLNASLLRAARR